jgi:hypothetical protein
VVKQPGNEADLVALPQAIDLPVSATQKAGWGPELALTIWMCENSRLYRDSNSYQTVTSRYTNYEF